MMLEVPSNLVFYDSYSLGTFVFNQEFECWIIRMCRFKTTSRQEDNSLNFDSDLKFLLELQKISMSLTHTFLPHPKINKIQETAISVFSSLRKNLLNMVNS